MGPILTAERYGLQDEERDYYVHKILQLLRRDGPSTRDAIGKHLRMEPGTVAAYLYYMHRDLRVVRGRKEGVQAVRWEVGTDLRGLGDRLVPIRGSSRRHLPPV